MPRGQRSRRYRDSRKVKKPSHSSLREAIIALYAEATKAGESLTKDEARKIVYSKFPSFKLLTTEVFNTLFIQLKQMKILIPLKKGSHKYMLNTKGKPQQEGISQEDIQKTITKQKLADTHFRAMERATKGFSGNIAEKPSLSRFRTRTAQITTGITDKANGELIYHATEVRKQYREASTFLPNKSFIETLEQRHGYSWSEIQHICSYTRYDWYYLLGIISRKQWLNGDQPTNPRKIAEAHSLIAKIFNQSWTQRRSREIKNVANFENFKSRLYKKYKEFYLIQGYKPKDAHRLAYGRTGKFLEDNARTPLPGKEDEILPSITKMRKNTEADRTEFNRKLHWQLRREFMLRPEIKTFLPSVTVNKLLKNKNMNNKAQLLNVREATTQFRDESRTEAFARSMHDRYMKLLKAKANPYAGSLVSFLNEEKVPWTDPAHKVKVCNIVAMTIHRIAYKFATDTYTRFLKRVIVPLGENFDVHDPMFDVRKLVKENPFEWRVAVEKADVAHDVIAEWQRSGQMPNVYFTSQKSNYPWLKVEGSTVFDIFYHVWFSPRARVSPFLFSSEQEFQRFKNGIHSAMKRWGLQHATIVDQVGFGADHVHLHLKVPPSRNLKDIVAGLKRTMTNFIHSNYPVVYKRVQPMTDEDLSPRKGGVKIQVSKRFWQAGFGAQAFGDVDREKVEKYITGQLEKERKTMGLDADNAAQQDHDREAQARKATEGRMKARQLEQHAEGLRNRFLQGIETNPRSYIYTGSGEPQVLLQVFERAGYRCEGCGADTLFLLSGKRYLQVDHKVPLSKGGTNAMENLQVLCLRCHEEKTSREVQ